MTLPLIASAKYAKILPPQLPKVVWRRRLLDRLSRSASKRLVLIVGQAAQGKTTLAACWVQRDPRPTAWLNLSAGEADGAALFGLLLEALMASRAESLNEQLRAFAKLYGIDANSPAPAPLRDWIRHLFDALSQPPRVVLDGLDRLPADAPCLSLIAALLEDVPPNVQLVLISREEPRFLPLEQLRVRRQLLTIDNSELAFTPQEIARLFREVRGVNLATRQGKRIQASTEGWVGGLVLLAEMLERIPPNRRERYLGQELPGGFRADVFRFFGEQAFGQLAPQLKRLLMCSALFDEVEPSLMNELLGEADAAPLLQQLAERHLFVEPVGDPGGERLYRYHALFRDFLLQQFERQVPPAQRVALAARTAALLEARGRTLGAILHFLQSGEQARAVALIERSGAALLLETRLAKLLHGLTLLPCELVCDNPWTLFFLAMACRYRDSAANQRALLRARELFQANGDRSGQLLSLAYLMEASIRTGKDVEPFDLLVEQAQCLLSSTPTDPRTCLPCATLWFFIGYGLILRGIDPQQGLSACGKAKALAQQAGDPVLPFFSQIHTSMAYYLLGEYEQVAVLDGQLRPALDRLPYTEPHAKYDMICCLTASELGDLVRAEELLGELAHQLEAQNLSHLRYFGLIAELLLRYAQGAFARIPALGAELLALGESQDNLYAQAMAHFVLGLACYHQDEHQQAAACLQCALAVFGDRDSHHAYHCHVTRLVLGLVLRRLADRQQGLEQVETALAYFNRIKNQRLLAECHLALGLILSADNRNVAARIHCEQGFAIMRARGYARFAAIGPGDGLQLCTLALQLPSAAPLAAQILSRYPAEPTKEQLKAQLSVPQERVRARARRVHRALHLRERPRLRIATFGGLAVQRGDRLVEEGQWQRVQPKRLLMALLCHTGPAAVPREVLMEDLWPDGDPQAVERNFRVTLHRLRRVIEPDMDRDCGSAYIETSGGLVSLNRALCEIDLERFLTLAEAGRLADQEGDAKTALSRFTQAASLYRGEFLPEERDGHWALSRREELKRQALSLMLRVAELRSGRGQFNKAAAWYERALTVEPLHEPTYQRLMQLYAEAGRQADVIRTYHACSHALRHGLDAHPSAATIGLLNQLNR